MTSYEKRLNSFKDSTNPIFKEKKSLFAINGFILDAAGNGDNVTCQFCLKSLEGWEPNDDPLVEHYLHSKKCFILNLKTYLPRTKSFDFYKKNAVNSSALSKFGYFAYAIKEDIPEIFCFKCGEMCNTAQKNYLLRCKSHFSKCSKKKIGASSEKNCDDFFFSKLLKGEFNAFLDEYLTYKASFFEKSDLFVDLLNGPPHFTVKEVLMESLNDFLSEVNEKMENDENKAVNEIEGRK